MCLVRKCQLQSLPQFFSGACEAAKTEFTWVNKYFGGKRNSLPRSFGDANGALWTDTSVAFTKFLH